MSGYLLVHGAFCGGWVWDPVAERLRMAGLRVWRVNQLPSAGTDSGSLGDLSVDADCVRQLLDAIKEPVVLVGHSYGGMVVTEVADHPKVRHSVYLNALWPQRGQTALDLFGGALPNSIVWRGDRSLSCASDPGTLGVRAATLTFGRSLLELFRPNVSFEVSIRAAIAP